MRARLVAWMAFGLCATGVVVVASCGGSTSQGSPDASTASGASSSGSGSGAAGSGSSGSASGSEQTTGTTSGTGATGSASGSASGSGAASGTSTGSTSGSSSGASSTGTTTSTGASVTQFHKNPTRDGVYVDAKFNKTAVGTMHRDTTFAPTVTGSVYAQPLYLANGPNGGDEFFVATEQNHLVAIDGTGKQVWDKTFGAPATSGLPCGNINPLGITGTPVIDASASPPIIYFDTMTTGPKHMIHAVSLKDGMTEQPGFPIDVSAKVSGFDSPHQNQRGALLLLNGTLYVPYGGHYGDCDPYYGWVLGVNVSNGSVTSWHTKASRGGIWAVGGVASDGTSIFAATGNTEGAGSTWGDGEGILRLTPALAFSGANADYFATTAWSQDDSFDTDLGGTGPILFDLGGAHYVIAMGKDTNLYVLNRDNMGGIGGSLTSTSVSNGELIGAGAVYTTSQGTYVAIRVYGSTPKGCPSGGGGNLAAAKITAGTPPTAKVVWCAAEGSLGSPMVTTDNAGTTIVWDANTRLYGYDGDTGMKLFAGGASGDAMAAGVTGFTSPIAANGRIVVGVPGYLYSFKP